MAGTCSTGIGLVDATRGSQPSLPCRTVSVVEHYAEAFCLLSERCFRMVMAGDGTGHAQRCPYLTKWRGRFQDAAGKGRTVEACDGHRADLISVQWVR